MIGIGGSRNRFPSELNSTESNAGSIYGNYQKEWCVRFGFLNSLQFYQKWVNLVLRISDLLPIMA